MKNTKRQGIVQFFFYPNKKHGWCGVCKEFGIVHYDKDLDMLIEDIKEMAEEHLKLVQTKKLPNSNLNRNVSLVHKLYFKLFILRRIIKNKGNLINLNRKYNNKRGFSFAC